MAATMCVRALSVLVASVCVASAPTQAPDRDAYVTLSWNDIGMHCMNHWHHTLSILPPYNNLWAQAIRVGSTGLAPEIVTAGVTVEYSIPGNTYSVGKTDFWSYEDQLFGVELPDNVGLTGKGLTGVLDLSSTHFQADGIPITPFPDATPTLEDPFQQAHVILRGSGGTQLAESWPVIPVSVEMGCVSSGCHGSETQILNMHSDAGGFDPAATPILCAECHADPALGTQGIPQAGYFSRAIHGKHAFIDETIPGIAGCYKCHPGQNTQCLRDVMSWQFGLNCQSCHGGIEQVSESISSGRIPWLQEPSCRTCHGAQYGEPVGQLYRHSVGHGGVACSACHGSPHVIFPSREPRDNANTIALQGFAGTLSDCRVCHGQVPLGSGPHGIIHRLELAAQPQNGTIHLQWTASEYPAASAFWVYGAVNQAYFEPGFAPGFEHRIGVLPVGTTALDRPGDAGDPAMNWTYAVIMVDATGREIMRSNRVGEHDFLCVQGNR